MFTCAKWAYVEDIDHLSKVQNKAKISHSKEFLCNPKQKIPLDCKIKQNFALEFALKTK